jgi:hypothetical protein
MNVPLDRLYNFLDDAVNHNLIIYRWTPHGSKLLTNLSHLKPYTLFEIYTNPIVVCHDQEPLDYHVYSDQERIDALSKIKVIIGPPNGQTITDYIISKKYHLNYIRELANVELNIYDNYLLLHSELNSLEIENYTQYGAVPVYYFSHALISRDWFRYAEVDPLITKKNIKKDFLIYQRAWSGSREYRLKFAELLIKENLLDNCITSFNPTDENNLHYVNHCYKNDSFKTQLTDIENHFLRNVTPSHASADYNVDDYNNTRFEIVLETLFDDQRWHLTEKIFRPIACGQPFILASTPGALEYLKNYGFNTFGNYIDESYDTVTDPVERLKKILDVMKHISNLSVDEKDELSNNLKDITEYNRKLFFSQEFCQTIVNEYLNNIKSGLDKIKMHKGACMKWWNNIGNYGFIDNFFNKEEYQKFVNMINIDE